MRKALAAIGVALIVILGVLLFREHRQRESAEDQLGLASSRVLSAIFTQQQDLRVATLKGDVVAKSANDGWVFHSEQTTRAPYTVSYFVDLGRIRTSDYRWDAGSKTMTVTIGDVVVDRPNIDMTKAAVFQNGLWISRSAGLSMERQSAERLSGRAAATAKSDENMAKARNAAVAAVSNMVRKPLAAAGLGEVKVRVRYPWEGDDKPFVPIDHSRDWHDVIGNSH
jgi:hypothetical protein